MNALPDVEIRYRLLTLLSRDGSLSQREMSRKVGISLGKINRFLSDISRRGLVLMSRAEPTGRSRVRFSYLLTPAGFEEKAELALNFLRAKIGEYEKVREQIRELAREVRQADLLPEGLKAGERELI